MPNELVYTWCGKPITEMSREELIEALKEMHKLYGELSLSTARKSRKYGWLL